MTATYTSRARQIGDYLASLIDERELVHSLWVAQRNAQVELWLIVDVDDIDHEQTYHALLGPLLGEYPDTSIDYRVLNLHRVDKQTALDSIPDGSLNIEV